MTGKGDRYRAPSFGAQDREGDRPLPPRTAWPSRRRLPRGLARSQGSDDRLGDPADALAAVSERQASSACTRISSDTSSPMHGSPRGARGRSHGARGMAYAHDGGSVRGFDPCSTSPRRAPSPLTGRPAVTKRNVPVFAKTGAGVPRKQGTVIVDVLCRGSSDRIAECPRHGWREDRCGRDGAGSASTTTDVAAVRSLRSISRVSGATDAGEPTAWRHGCCGRRPRKRCTRRSL